MNARERMLALGVLLVAVLLAGGFMVQWLFLAPLDESNDRISKLQQENQKKQDRVKQIEADLPKLDRWKRLSLPANQALAKRDYALYLNDLMRESGFAPGTFTVTPPQQIDSKSSPAIPNKGPVYHKLTYVVQAHTSLDNLVTMLNRFYRTSLLHEIKKLSILRPVTLTAQQQPTDLDINFTVEALIVSGGEDRASLRPGPGRTLLMMDVLTAMRGGPAGIAPLPWVPGPTGPFGPGILARTSEQYAAIAAKNIFLGPTPAARPAADVEVTQFVRLIDITRNNRRTEAWLYNRYTLQYTRLRAEPGFDSFKIVSEKGDTLVAGKVVRLEPRDLIFKVDEKFYSMHLDQTLEDAMKKPLSNDQRKQMGLVVAADTIRN